MATTEQVEEALRSRVYQGLQKRKRCGLCEQEFFVEELPGAITFKSILELREKWRHDNSGAAVASDDEVEDVGRQAAAKGITKREQTCINRLYRVKQAPGGATPMPSPSRLYKRVELCIFCMQFFDVDGGSSGGDHNATMNDTRTATAGSTGSPTRRGY